MACTTNVVFQMVILIAIKNSWAQFVSGPTPANTCLAKPHMNTVCYISLGYEAETWNSLTPEILDLYLCSHYVAAFGQIDYDGKKNPIIWFPANASKGGKKFLLSLIEASKIRPNLQFFISIGGHGDLSYPDKYCQMIYGHEQGFLANLAELVEETEVDGIDFYWDFIGRFSSIEKELECLHKITISMCNSLHQKGIICMITLRIKDVHALEIQKSVRVSQLIQQIIRKADIINIWTIDLLETTQDEKVMPVFPQDFLKPENLTKEKVVQISPLLDQINVNRVVEFYAKVCQNQTSLLRKLSMVIATHSKMYAVEPNSSLDLPPPSIGMRQGWLRQHAIIEYLRTFYPFYLTCARLHGQSTEKLSYHEYPELNGLGIAFNHQLSKGNSGVATFPPSPKLVAAKAAYARKSGLGGVAIYQIAADDIHGWCYNESYPLVHAIVDELLSC